MIHDVFEVLANDINRFLKSKHNITEDKVVISSIMTAEGSIAVLEPDKIVMSMVGIEVDRSKSNSINYKKTRKGDFIKELPAVNANVNILFSAYFSSENYLEGLKFITSIIAYFQSSSSNFTPQNLPGLQGITDRFTTEIITLNAHELSNLWGVMGAKYMPSVLYRLKSLPIRHVKPQMPTPVIVKT